MQRNPAILALFVGLFAPTTALAASWPEVEGLVRPALADLLTDAEIDRLLARDSVKRALRTALEGWDGRDDRLTVRLDGDGNLLVKASLGEARTVCTTTLNRGEGGASEPVCTEEVERVARDLELGRDLWRPPHRPKPRPPEPPKPSPLDDAPPSDTVIRRPDIPELPEAHGPEVLSALREWSDFQGDLNSRYWKDPFLPKDLTESGTALIEPPGFSPLLEEGMTANLRNPFDEARLGALVDIPVPKELFLSRDVNEAPIITPLDAECVANWQADEDRKTPPSIACFRAFTQNTRLESKPFFQIRKALSQIGLNFSNPLLDFLASVEMKEVASHRAYRVVWAAVWLDFVNAAPGERLAPSLAALDDEERRFLRRRLWRWWIAQDLGPYRTLITSIYERHFVALYPEARDAAGLPKRAFFNNTWLWVSNWLSEVGRLPDETVAAAYHRLGEREQRVIDAFVADAMIAQRFPGPCALLKR